MYITQKNLERLQILVMLENDLTFYYPFCLLIARSNTQQHHCHTNDLQ